MAYMLGKLPPIIDSRTLKFAKYLPTLLPEIPVNRRWQDIKCPTEWGMDGNDRYGNCVIVTAAHIIDCARAHESSITERVSDTEVIQLSNEMGALQGYYILTRLKWWRQRGMFDSQISAFCSIDLDHDLIRSAINIFGHADIGLEMPRAWENKDVWDRGEGYDYQKNSWGGHSVPLLGYETRPTTIIYYACTWGKIVAITKQAIDYYCDEIYTSILSEWYEFDNLSPSQFNLQQMEYDLAQIEGA